MIRILAPETARCMFALMIVGLFSALGSCETQAAATPSQQRAETLRTRDESLRALFVHRPGAQERVRQAPGYAVFADLSQRFQMLGSGRGYGVCTDNKTGRNTYMRMAQSGAGNGKGIQAFRMIIVFKTSRAMVNFVTRGWTLRGDVEVLAKIGSFGGVGAVIPLDDRTIYILSEMGVAPKAIAKATEFHRDNKLN